MEGNGQTKEQILLAKKKRFEEHPEGFIELNDLVLAISKTSEKGNFMYISYDSSRRDYMYAQAEAIYQTTKMMQILDIKKAQKENKIVLPNTGIRSFLNKKRR